MTNTRERKHELIVPVRGGGNVKLKSCSVYYLQTLKIYFNIFSSLLLEKFSSTVQFSIQVHTLLVAV